MNSEHISLKQDKEKGKSSKNKINKFDDKSTIDEEVKKPKLNTLVHIRQVSSLSDSVINYLVIGMCFFIYGCFGLEWFEVAKETNLQFFLGYYLVAGIVLYLIGIINWYEGKELIFLTNFILSFLFISLYLKNQNLGNITEFFEKENNNKLQGIFYIVLFALLLIIGISSKSKGFIYIIDYAILFVTYVLLFVYKFYGIDIIKTIDSYFFIVCGALYWLTGMLKLLNNSTSVTIKLLEPTD